MQWEKAKNFMLIFFLIVNVFLMALIRYEAGGHTLSRERENAILAVLEQNNIIMYYQIPRQFAPMRYLQVAAYDYDFDRMLEIFGFPPGEYYHFGDANRDEFRWGDYTLIVSNGYISFTSAQSADGMPERMAAVALTQAFIRDHYPDFRLDIHSTRQDRWGGLRIIYRQVYNDVLIHTNFVEFLVTGEGHDLIIAEVDLQYRKPIGFAYLPRELIGSDEALLTFVQNVRHQDDMPIIITHMDIAYFQIMPGLRATYVPIYAEPFYRIFIEGQDEPFLISAYTNQIE